MSNALERFKTALRKLRLRDHGGSDPLERFQTALADSYTVERELGRGGMATVYLARDRKHERQVAVKVMRPELSAVLGGQRFLREIRIAARLNHPHILALHDSGEADGFLYYVMPLVEGESLRAKIEREKQLSIDEAVTITGQVASALDYAHQQGVIHRDIKPENILLHRNVAVVADFGIALAVTAAAGERLTDTGLSLGTPQYMSPEQATGTGEVDGRSDIYSLGAVLYEMVTGEPPHTGATVPAIMAKLLSQPPVQPRVVRDSVPEAVDRAIMTALAKAPADRFDRAAQFAQALTAGVTPEGDVKSIVVLPFENLSPDPDNAFFADGLIEDLIAELSAVRQLRVISRTSAMQFKDSKKSVPTIARELNVRYALEGSVRRAGESVKITAQLIDASTDSHLWADRYTGKLDDIFKLQDRLSRRITEALRVALTPDEVRRIACRRFDDFQAYDALLRARREMMKLSKEGIERAIHLVHRAREIAGENALVHATLARCYSLSHEFGVSRDGETLERADRHASKALDLAPDLGLALFAKAHVLQRQGRDYREVVRLLRHARETDRNTDALTFLASVLAQVGNIDEAREVAAEALVLDPLDCYTRAVRGWVDFLDGKFDAAVSLFQELSDDPHWHSPHIEWILAQALAQSGQLDEAGEAFARVAATDAVPVADLSGLYCRAAVGDRRAVAAHLSERHLMVETAKTDELFPMFIADCLAIVGDEEGALEWLGRAIDWGFANHRYLEEHDRFLKPLHGNTRFKALIDRARRKHEAFDA